MFHDGVELKPEEMPAQVATATGKPVTDMEVELVFSDGRQVHLIESAVPLFDSDGRVRGAVITGRMYPNQAIGKCLQAYRGAATACAPGEFDGNFRG